VERKRDKKNGLIRASLAAQRLRLPNQTVLRLIYVGTLEATMIGNRWWISERSVGEYERGRSAQRERQVASR